MTTDDPHLPLASGFELSQLRREFEDFRDEYDLLVFQNQLNALADQVIMVRRHSASNAMRITANFALDMLQKTINAGGDDAAVAQECVRVLSARVAKYKAEVRVSSEPEKLTREWDKGIDEYMREHGFSIFVEE